MGPVKLRNSHTLLKTTHLGHTITYNHPAQCSITRITLHYTISIHMIPIAHKTSTHYTYYHHSTHTLYHARDPHYIASLNTPQLLKQCPIDTPTPKHPHLQGCLGVGVSMGHCFSSCGVLRGAYAWDGLCRHRL